MGGPAALDNDDMDDILAMKSSAMLFMSSGPPSSQFSSMSGGSSSMNNGVLSSSFQSVATAQRARALKKQGGGTGSSNMDDMLAMQQVNHEPELQKLEQRLTEEVDEDFFEEPRRFNTLPRVIDVLGVQMVDDATAAKSAADRQNPAFCSLKAQQKVVEDAIEHLAVIHCADLNASVIQVGRVARQFNQAVDKVRSLRKSVREIQDSLGPNNNNNNNDSNAANKQPAAQTTAAMSLRELWLKKLECEATLSLLDKLDVIRAAPTKFDALTKRARIGAAVLTVSQALDTMFRDDVAQVQALHKIMEQLMIRKQTAEEVVWDTLQDVLFLRTGNGLNSFEQPHLQQTKTSTTTITSPTTALESDGMLLSSSGRDSVSSGTNKSLLKKQQSLTAGERATSAAAGGTSASNSNGMDSPFVVAHGMINPFCTKSFMFATDPIGESDDDSVGSEHSNASLFSVEGTTEDDGVQNTTTTTTKSSSSGANMKLPMGIMSKVVNAAAILLAGKNNKPPARLRFLIPIPMMEAELDLENDERRIQEDIRLAGGMAAISAAAAARGNFRHSAAGMTTLHHRHNHRLALPRYADPVIALRLLVECLFLLKRLDDVERNVQEHAAYEIRALVQREQARTFARLEKRQRSQSAAVLRTTRGGVGGGGAGGGMVGGGLLGQHQAQDTLKDFRRHLTGLLSAFGSVQLRLAHLAQILRFRISSDRELMQKMEAPTAVMRGVITFCQEMMQTEIKAFLQACLKEEERTLDTALDSSAAAVKAEPGQFFSLGVLQEDNKGVVNTPANRATATRTNVMEMPMQRFVTSVLFPNANKNKTKAATPHIKHALIFRRMVARWTQETEALQLELAKMTGESLTNLPQTKQTTSTTTNSANNSSNNNNNMDSSDALQYLDRTIQRDLLPAMQEEAVNGTVLGLERRDGFDPVLDRAVYRPGSSEPHDVDMCIACQSVYLSTGPLFHALHRLPRGGEMYSPVVAVLEHVMLTFLSRIKQQVAKLCESKTALQLLEADGGKPSTLAMAMERRRPFIKLVHAYADGELMEAAKTATDKDGADGAVKLPPPPGDTAPNHHHLENEDEDGIKEINVDGIEGEELIMEQEMKALEPWLDFSNEAKIALIKICSDEELMKAETLAHSLLKVASLLENRLKVRQSSQNDGFSNHKPLPSTRQLRDSIKSVMQNGLKMAKFCRLDVLFQTVVRLAKVAKSSTLVARDAVRIPSSVNDLGEYLTGASDNLREAAGNAVTAYTFSSLEQYIPFCLMQTVRLVAHGKGIIKKAPLTMNGIEALDRSGSVLYRDLKAATSFDHSFWDVDLAAYSFERSASFMAMMELEMEELVAYYNANQSDFSEADFILMFTMDGPRRKGDVSRFHMMKRRQTTRAS